MAKIKTNPIIQELSGGLGRELMFRRLRDGRTILCAKPDFSNRVFSEKQINHQQRFQEAAAYAKAAAKANPIYAEIAAGTMKTAYNVALSDWFHPPEILKLDLDAWTGQAGDRISIKAQDDVLVAAIGVVITDGDEEILAQGEATPIDELWWEYIVPVTIAGAAEVVATAMDLPGHLVQIVDEVSF